MENSNMATQIRKQANFIPDIFNAKGISFKQAEKKAENSLPLKIVADVKEKHLDRIPREGSFILIANHPLGSFDYLMLINTIQSIRPDFRILPSADFVNPTDKINGEPSVKLFDTNTLDGQLENSEEIKMHLKNGNAIGIFPANAETGFQFNHEPLHENRWNEKLVSFIKEAEVPVLPVLIKVDQSNFQRILTSFNLRFFIPSGFNVSTKVKIRIGRPIKVSEQREFQDVNQYGRFLRAKLFTLGASMKVTKLFKASLKGRKKMPKPILAPIDRQLLLDEYNQLKNHYELFANDQYAVLCFPSIKAPWMLREIGRLRELTFREVGEGTNRELDLDEFDIYYHQLILWDKQAHQIIGGYRMGFGHEIMAQYNSSGFYLNTLFKFKEQFNPVLEQSIELGRSFVIKEYQKKPLPLFWLWKGIMYQLFMASNYRYLIGPVSISNDFSHFSKELIVSFIQSHHFDAKMADLIKPRKPFEQDTKNQLWNQEMVEIAQSKLTVIDQWVEDFEDKYMKIPVLLKKYLKLNAKIVGFNVDPNFNNCLDGMIVLDVKNIPSDTIESLCKDFASLNKPSTFN
jgi:putative hemolysin